MKQSATKLIKSKQASKQASKRASKRATKQARKQESEQATKQASKQASNRAPMGCSGFREIPIRISIGSSSYGLRAAISPQVPFTMSVLQMLTKACPAQAVADRSVSSVGGDVRAWVASVDDYIAKIKEDIDSKRVSIQGQPLITSSHVMGMARNMEKEMKDQDLQPPTVAEALSLASRPDVYIWAPDKIFPGLSIKCPACSGAVKSREWTKARILHGIATQMVYITVKYRCRACACRIGPQAAATTKVKQRIFQADSPTVLATFPRYVQATWQFYDSGKIICEASVVDFIRALAIRASWSGIAETINELKEQAWLRTVHGKFHAVCNALHLEGDVDAISYPREYSLSAEWIRNVYVADATARQASVAEELKSETGDDVLVVDWTIDAAKRCAAKYLFNAMDGRRRILMSSLVSTCAPDCVKPLMANLAKRGVKPKVVYVDCECCGTWADTVRDLWPKAVVKLDGMHAMRRLTTTTSSTQHPWHDRFCHALSEAVYTYDATIMTRLRIARKKHGLSQHVPSNVRSKYVPRVIKDSRSIADRIEKVLADFEKPHCTAGPLLTTCTSDAWQRLREHVVRGCLCDPIGLHINRCGKQVTIGGEKFNAICSLRGTSALEGFHTHQKQWLGCLAIHAADAGAALLADGALRWNRKRQRDD